MGSPLRRLCRAHQHRGLREHGHHDQRPTGQHDWGLQVGVVFEQVLGDPGGLHNSFYIPGDSSILVDRCGLRVVDEKRNYNDRAMVHQIWVTHRVEWINMLLFMVHDEMTATL